METSNLPVVPLCRNCEVPLPRDAAYCHQCGQKNTTGKVSVLSFLNEFFTEHLNLDSKLALTAWHLFQPGKLTDEYFKGRHKTYASPLRLFLVTGLVLFTIIGINIFSEDLEINQYDQLKATYQKKLLLVKVDSIIQEKKADYTQAIAVAALDSLADHLSAKYKSISDSIDLSDIDLSLDLPKISIKDFIDLDAKALMEKYSIDQSFTVRLLFIQSVKAVKKGDSLAQYIFNKLSLGILFMMPFLAMFLKLLYVRRKRFYVEHLVFSFHYHAFTFLIISLLLILLNYFPDYLIAIAILSIFAYLFLAMKKVYQQSWLITGVKYILLNMAYLMLLFVFAMLTILVSFLLF